MRQSSRPKEKYGNSTFSHRDILDNGTSARTRPFSFDEIMLMRKSKKESEPVTYDERNIAASPADASNNAAEGDESIRSKHVDMGTRHTPGDSQKERSRKKEDNSVTMEANPIRVTDKEMRVSDTKSKANPSKDINEKSERHIHGTRKKDLKSIDDSKYDYIKRNHKDLAQKDSSTGRSGGKYERERKRKEQIHDSDIELVKRQSKDLRETERYGARSKEKSEYESKRRSRTEDDERDRDMEKQPDLRKSRNSEISERRNLSSKGHYEELKPKRRRSRSRERNKDRDRRSSSLSPEAHKISSREARGRGDLDLPSSKEKSGRLLTDVDRKKVSNGSSSHHRDRRASGLGGYSPRKRKSEAAAKTPSPTNRSPGRRSAGWDLPPSSAEKHAVEYTLPTPTLQPTSQTSQTASSVATPSSQVKLPGSSLFNSSSVNAIDSIQLTQATRPMRRLYIENLPASTSEKAVLDCINNFLLSSGFNHIQGTHPCISCLINKEKGQAVLEFLTPEDASAALSFDGRLFSGSTLRIRRPRDFIETATGVPDKSLADADSMNDTVEESPHKIFVGGIPQCITTEMFLGIAKAFGPLKAYHFEVNKDLNGPCAFLEYVDHSVTPRACAGLNGMKLGGQVITVVQSIPDALNMEIAHKPPLYGIPKHAKPLLERSTQVLKLTNVLDPESLLSMAETELEEILEDVRLECTRFGTVKSIHITRHSQFTTQRIMDSDMDGVDTSINNESSRTGKIEENMVDHDKDTECLKLVNTIEEPCGIEEAVEVGHSCDDIPSVSFASSSLEDEGVDEALFDNSGTAKDENEREDTKCEQALNYRNSAVKDPMCQETSLASSREPPCQEFIQPLEGIDEGGNASPIGVSQVENKSMLEDPKVDLSNGDIASEGEDKKVMEVSERDMDDENISDLGGMFEPGCILVEFKRTEAACIAAHCLDGRLYDNHKISVEYVTHDLYKKMFPK